MKKLFTIGLLCSLALSLNAQYMKLDASFYSQALDEVKKVDIYLPTDYYENLEQEYAVIYFLHGGGGNQNSGAQRASIYYSMYSQDTTISSPPAIFVCPDGSCEPYLGSLWVNSVLYGNYEDFVVHDLITFIETNFRAFSDKNFRIITGTSMGGFGSSWLSVNHTDKFRACFPFISAFISLPDTTLNTWRNMCYDQNGSYNLNYNAGFETRAFFTAAGAWSPNMEIEPYNVEIPFDTLGNWVDTIVDKWYQFDVARKVKNLPKENELAWFLGCGTTDYMITYPAYQVFMDSLDFYDIAYDHYYFEGGHVFDPDTWVAGCHWMDSIINYSYQTMGVEIIKIEESTFNLYPNPARQTLNISFSTSEPKTASIIIFNQMGQKLKTIKLGNVTLGNHEIAVDISILENGIYFLQLQVEKSIITKKFIKQ